MLYVLSHRHSNVRKTEVDMTCLAQSFRFVLCSTVFDDYSDRKMTFGIFRMSINGTLSSVLIPISTDGEDRYNNTHETTLEKSLCLQCICCKAKKYSNNMSSCNNLDGDIIVQSDKCEYTDETIVSDYTYVLNIKTTRMMKK